MRRSLFCVTLLLGMGAAFGWISARLVDEVSDRIALDAAQVLVETLDRLAEARCPATDHTRVEASDVPDGTEIRIASARLVADRALVSSQNGVNSSPALRSVETELACSTSPAASGSR